MKKEMTREQKLLGDFFVAAVLVAAFLGMALGLFLPVPDPDKPSYVAPWMTNGQVERLSAEDYQALVQHKLHPSNQPLPDHLKPKGNKK
jgi:hypothetical protein